ncbi:MAG: FkbM family methyltransferase [Cyclobacteriaceae bacterium]|nr:FkbM family methyltransferase [Cyclobacteriaceae bacterium]
MNAILHRLPLTRIKLLIARILYLIVRPVFGKEKRVISRNGIQFEIDLSEGLDLSLFLFGNFQVHVSENKFLSLQNHAVIFDVGANVGIMSLNFAKNSAHGKVYAFEPTHYAYRKLIRNLDLNPELAGRIVPVQTFVSAKPGNGQKIQAYSSWKINSKVDGERHPVHGGAAMSADGVPTVTLDSFVIDQKISQVDFIKIDTDGHEFDVLMGARELLATCKPKIIFELGLYVMEERGIGFMDYWGFFQSLNYRLSDAATNRPITTANFAKMIPQKGTIDVLAVAN